jgi:PKD repeat protein
MPKRITSLDRRYNQGDLSVFPKAIDSSLTLFEVNNNLETRLSHNVTATSKYIIVENSSNFPSSGLLRIGNPNNLNQEILFYGRKIGNQFHLLQRGYGRNSAGSWNAGTVVTAPVMSEHHNALKDAIIKIENKLGLAANPDPQSIHGTIRTLEHRWLTPKPGFKAFPLSGNPPLTVCFQNFSGGHGLHYLWDFGDGSTSTDKNPVHTYLNDGHYTVKLNMVSMTNAQGFTEKNNYIKVSNELRSPFFYGRPLMGYSNSTTFNFVDQTDGDIVERHWFFGDNTDVTVSNPNNHTIERTRLY